VARDGNIVYQGAFGYRNFETMEKLDNNSVFELASVSKQFTAMGILLLVEKKKIKLTDTLRHFFPQLPYTGITIRHLLTHTAGMPEYDRVMEGKWDETKVAFNDDVINFLATENPAIKFKPGARWEYSNTGYLMLASIIEKVSGKSFKDYMQENIFKPLSMTHSRVYNTRRSKKEVIPNYAFGYVHIDSLDKYILPDSVPELNFVFWLDGIQGDGIINSTTGDLLKWDRALKHNKLLSAELQKEMLSAQEPLQPNSSDAYGYGVILTRDTLGDKISHSGGWAGYVTYLSRNVDKDITVVVLSNNMSSSSAIANSLSHIMHKMEVHLPYKHEEISIDTATLEKFTGKYKGTNVIVIVKKDGKLFRKNGPSSIELKPESPSRFFYADGTDRYIDFIIEDNVVNKALIYINGLKTEMQKLR
jgi:CubicO group peptidase (beta-lactamase class C family)